MSRSRLFQPKLSMTCVTELMHLGFRLSTHTGTRSREARKEAGMLPLARPDYAAAGTAWSRADRLP